MEDAEQGVHSVLKEYGLSCPVEVGSADLGPKELAKFPFILLSVWLRYLGLTRIARQLCGCSSLSKMKRVLKEFWTRYETINGGHAIFEKARSGEIELGSTIPFFTHSDEGRSYKKEAIWIFSVHGVLGRGTRQFLRKKKHLAPLHRSQMGMNFIGHTWSTQLLFATMLRTTAAEYPEGIPTLMKLFSDDAASLITEGLTIDGVKLWFLHLGTKGDLPALGKLGGFKRTFSHCPRAPRSKKACVGICHQCLGGQEADAAKGMEAFPFEDLSVNASWHSTLDRVPPWETMPVIMQGVPINVSSPSKFFCFDIWHVFHLGVAKHWAASSFVLIIESGLPVLQAYRSVEAKFAFVSTEYRSFCRSRKISMWISEISRDTLLWPQSSSCPIGKWNKGSASTTIMLFLAHFCQLYIVGKTDDEKLGLIVTWCKV